MQLALYLGLGEAVASQLYHSIVASSARPADVVEPDLDRLAALPVINIHRDTPDFDSVNIEGCA